MLSSCQHSQHVSIISIIIHIVVAAQQTLCLAGDSGRSSSLVRSSTVAYDPAPIPVAKGEIRGFCKHEASVRVCEIICECQ